MKLPWREKLVPMTILPSLLMGRACDGAFNTHAYRSADTDSYTDTNRCTDRNTCPGSQRHTDTNAGAICDPDTGKSRALCCVWQIPFNGVRMMRFP